MKKLLLLNFIFCLTVCAQSPSTPLGTQVTPVNTGFVAPAIVTSKFTTEFPNSDPSWSMAGENYAAEILDGSTQLKRIVIYDSFGNKLLTSSESAPGSYPKPIGNYFKKNYPDNKYQIWAIQKKDSISGFYSLQNKDTLWFDKEGNSDAHKRSIR